MLSSVSPVVKSSIYTLNKMGERNPPLHTPVDTLKHDDKDKPHCKLNCWVVYYLHGSLTAIASMFLLISFLDNVHWLILLNGLEYISYITIFLKSKLITFGTQVASLSKNVSKIINSTILEVTAIGPWLSQSVIPFTMGLIKVFMNLEGRYPWAIIHYTTPQLNPVGYT